MPPVMAATNSSWDRVLSVEAAASSITPNTTANPGRSGPKWTPAGTALLAASQVDS